MHQLCMLNESLTHNNSLDLARSAQMQQTVCDQRLADPFVKRQQWPVYRFSAFSTKWENSCRECMIIREYEVTSMRVLAMSLREMERYHPRHGVMCVCVCLPRLQRANPYPSWVQSRHGLPTAWPLLLSLKGHSRGDRYVDVTSSFYI